MQDISNDGLNTFKYQHVDVSNVKSPHLVKENNAKLTQTRYKSMEKFSPLYIRVTIALPLHLFVQTLSPPSQTGNLVEYALKALFQIESVELTLESISCIMC